MKNNLYELNDLNVCSFFILALAIENTPKNATNTPANVNSQQQVNINSNATTQSATQSVHNEMRYNETELILLYDYKAQAPDDLSVRRGDWVYADLNNQTVDGWLWAFAPKTRKYGFIPKAYARPPAMTSF